jgi:hypothetical protein
MRLLRRARPSPAMVVAVVALSFALAGSALAGTDALTSKLDKTEKKQVKKIAKKQANKRISKRAPGLSVANAVNATNATRADSAGSADSVGGLSLKRVFFKAAPNTPVAEIASLGVLRINAGCDAAGNVVATVEPASGAPPLELKHEGEGNVNPVFDDQNMVTTPRSITFGGSSAAGMVRVASTNGAVVTFDYGYDNAPTFGGENVCTLSGILIG